MTAASLPPLPSEITYSDLLAVLGLMIALATLVVTAAGVAVGVAAVFGYQAFKYEVGVKAQATARATSEKLSREVATRTVRKEARKYFKGRAFARTLSSSVKSVGAEIDWTPDTNAPASGERLADVYPPDSDKV